MRRFPAGFLWGVATSGHQTEGANTTSDTWFLEHRSPTVFREPSGDACDSFRLWDVDLDLVAGLGANAYRFSVEWARVEPEPGRFSEAALRHYEAVVDGCLARGLAPVVTCNHFTAPHWFAARGGFLDDDAARVFARYCGRLMAAFGHRLSQVVTLNEPNLHRLLRWLDLPDHVRRLEREMLEAAARDAGVARYRVANVVLPEDADALDEGMTAAHRAARETIRDHRPDLPVGWSLALVDDCVVGSDTSVRDRKRAELYDPYLAVAVDDDFVGVQNYERRWYDGEGEVIPRPDAPRNDMGSLIDPASLAGAVSYAHQRTGRPILVTEHGMSTADDQLRTAFLEPSLEALGRAMDDGVPVLGYLHWSLLDNWEWVFGHEGHLGLVAVDRTTFSRTPKPSAAELARLVKAASG